VDATPGPIPAAGLGSALGVGEVDEGLPGVHGVAGEGHDPFHSGLVLGAAHPGRVDQEPPGLGVFHERLVEPGLGGVGLFDDGSPGEVFITISKEGSTIRGLMDSVAVLTSLALQYGVPLEDLVRKFRGVHFEPGGFTNNPELPQASSLVDYVFRWLEARFIAQGQGLGVKGQGGAAGRRKKMASSPAVASADISTGLACPECGSVLVFAEGEAVRQAEEAGADYVGSDDLIKKIEGGWLEFDVALAVKEVMGKVGRLGRVLGPRGLMPNPRANTVVEAQDLPKAIRDAKQGRVEFRLDRMALVHVPIGKVSFSEEALLDNLAALVEAIIGNKPAGAKGQFIKTMTLTSTMGPGIKLDVQPTLSLTASTAV
jgi:ribosomal protein L1